MRITLLVGHLVQLGHCEHYRTKFIANSLNSFLRYCVPENGTGGRTTQKLLIIHYKKKYFVFNF